MKTGLERIKEERQRQIEIEDWKSEDDDAYTGKELMRAAHCYASGSDQGWPWHFSWWKPSPDVCRNYEKAGALYLAERDRLLRGGYWNEKLDGNLPELMLLHAENLGDRIDELLGQQPTKG